MTDYAPTLSPLAWELDVQWLKSEHDHLIRNVAKLRERGNHATADQREKRAARYLRLYNRLRLADSVLNR